MTLQEQALAAELNEAIGRLLVLRVESLHLKKENEAFRLEMARLKPAEAVEKDEQAVVPPPVEPPPPPVEPSP